MSGRSRQGLVWALFTLSLLLGGGVAWGVNVEAGRAQQAGPRNEERVDVVVARRTIPQGATVGAEDLAVMLVPKSVVPKSVVEGQVLLKYDEVIGRAARERILEGEPLRRERLAWPEHGVGLNATLEAGKRAMTVAVNTESAVAGLVRPGNYVDFLVTIRPEEGDAAWHTFTFLQAIEVLAVGRDLGFRAPAAEDGTTRTASGVDEKKLKPSLTVGVLPWEAERLALARSRGDVSIVLRSDMDVAVTERDSLVVDRLLGLERRALPPKAPRAVKVAAVETGGTTIVQQGGEAETVRW